MIPGEFFLHVGLHKTGTTWFQKSVYPAFRGINYLAKTKLEWLLTTNPEERYLLCEEALLRHLYGRSHEDNLPVLARLFPGAQIILGVRRQESWLKSAYNQHRRMGGSGPFSHFFDLEGDGGLVRHRDLLFSRIIDQINEHFRQAHCIVVPFDRVQADPLDVVARLAEAMGCTVDLAAVDTRRKNPSRRFLRHFDWSKSCAEAIAARFAEDWANCERYIARQGIFPVADAGDAHVASVPQAAPAHG